MTVAAGTTGAPGPLRARVRRGLGPGARTSDHVELLSWLCCVLLAVLVVPTALAVASVVAADAGAQAARQAAERQQVPGVLLEDAAVLSSAATSPLATARTAWTAPDGTPHEGTVPVPVGAREGETVRIWIGPDGERADRPLERGGVVVVTLTAGSLTLLLGLALAAVTHAGVCTLLDRARQRSWTREWEEVGPRWAARYRLH